MSAYCPASEVILRHTDELAARRLLFAGDLQDALPAHFPAEYVSAHSHQYHQWQLLAPLLEERVQFSLLPDAQQIAQCNMVIYYWPKSKLEAQFQLMSLLSQLPDECELLLVGENRSGVRSAETILAPYGPIAKIDSARRCSLYHFRAERKPNFLLNDWWSHYQLKDVTVNTLPGVFSHDGLDIGSELLLSALTNQPVQGQVLDIGCGAGTLSCVLGKQLPNITLTLTDVSAAALQASQASLSSNQLTGRVIASNVFSAIQERFNWIISNPPFHDGTHTCFTAVETLIRQAPKHLLPNGKLCIVANAFLPYPDLLDSVFGSHEVLAQTGRFKVYLATLRPVASHHKPTNRR